MKKSIHFLIVVGLCSLLTGCIGTIKLFTRDGKLMGVLPLIDGRVIYQERVQITGLPKEEIFKRARRWWVNNYRSARDVFQLVDKETGEIVGKGNGLVYIPIVPRNPLLGEFKRVYHVISFDVSDNAYTITVSGLAMDDPTASATTKRMYLLPDELPIERYNIGTVKSVTTTFKAINEQTLLTIKDLKDYIANPTPY